MSINPGIADTFAHASVRDRSCVSCAPTGLVSLSGGRRSSFLAGACAIHLQE